MKRHARSIVGIEAFRIMNGTWRWCALGKVESLSSRFNLASLDASGTVKRG